MPESSAKQQKDPCHKNNFTHRQEDDAYICPHGQELTFRGMHRRPEKGV